MKFNIVNIANKMPQWIIMACSEYLQRINSSSKYKCIITEFKVNNKINQPIEVNLKVEAKKILTYLERRNAFVVLLDETGLALTSIQFAKQVEKNIATSRVNEIIVLIGSANGVDQELKQRADLTIKLSSFTFPHALVRVIILEQIYRVITILENHPYHKE